MLEARALTKSYGVVQAVKHFTHRFVEGKITTILGPSGSGKSTALALLAGIKQADGGSVFLDDCDITSVPPERRDFGMVFQSYHLFPHLDVQKNVEFGLRVRGIARREREERARETLALTRIEHLASRRITEISGGEQQRVAMARSLAIRPKVLLMDEPLSALDAKLREELRAELLRLLAHLAITTIYVTHDQSEARRPRNDRDERRPDRADRRANRSLFAAREFVRRQFPRRVERHRRGTRQRLGKVALPLCER